MNSLALSFCSRPTTGLVLAVVLLTFGAASARAIPINPTATTIPGPLTNTGFETGDLGGWNVWIPSDESNEPAGLKPAGSVAIQETHRGVAPWEGDHFLAVGTAGSAYFFNGNTHDITASQSIWLAQGAVLSGWSAFYNGDYSPQDSAWVRIFNSAGAEVAMPWSQRSGGSDTAPVPYLETMPWTQWQFAADLEDTYTLVFGATTFGDDRFATFGYHDGISVPDAPSIATTGLALLVLLGLARLSARRR